MKVLFKLTVWSLRVWYPIIRFLGRVTGNEEKAESLIEVGEENIERTAEEMGIEGV